MNRVRWTVLPWCALCSVCTDRGDRASISVRLHLFLVFFFVFFFFYSWLCWVFVAAREDLVSLVVESRGYSSLRSQASPCGIFSCCGARALGSQASVVVAHGLNSCGAQA